MQKSVSNFPYPIYYSNSPDYKNAVFETLATSKLTNANFEINYEIKMPDKIFLSLISKGVFQYAIHLECPQTSYRKVITTEKTIGEISIPEKMINGQLEMSIFIICVEDYEKYTNTDFSSDFTGFTFDFEIGAVVGISNSFQFIINKEREDFLHIASIIKILKSPNKDLDLMQISEGDHQIKIYLPEEDFDYYVSLKRKPELHTVLASMIIVPALAYILEKLANNKIDSEVISSLRWYISLETQLEKKFEIKIPDITTYSRGTFALAQQLIGNPVSESLKQLFNEFTVESWERNENEN